MRSCQKCGGVDIVEGKVRASRDELFSELIFAPDGLRFLALTLANGTVVEAESLACLCCGTVWTRTDPEALRRFVSRYCEPRKAQEGEA